MAIEFKSLKPNEQIAITQKIESDAEHFQVPDNKLEEFKKKRLERILENRENIDLAVEQFGDYFAKGPGKPRLR